MRKFSLILILMCTCIMISFAQDPPTVSGETVICSGSSTALTAEGESGASFAWYDAETGGNLLASTATLTTGSLTTTISFYVEQTTPAGTSLRTEKTVFVTPIPSPLTPSNVTASPPAICIGQSSNLSAEVDSANYQVVKWYDAASGGNLLATTITGAPFSVSPTITTTYYAQSEVEIYTNTFGYTGGGQTFTVPPNIYSLAIDAYGARGGTKSYQTHGRGGRVQTTLAVTPGQVLNIYVGGAGGNYLGGYNGGGNSHNTSNSTSGGGATDIRIGGTSLNDRVVVAGGGGGLGTNGGGTWRGGPAHGGGLTGGAGYYTNSGPGSAKRGTGGTQTGGGNRGCWYGGSCGGYGAFGQGGAAGSSSGWRGGAGGGGWYGGGGGTADGGGGGGSSYTHPTLCSEVVHTPGARNSHGLLIITYFEKANCADITREPVTVTVNPLPNVVADSDTYNCPGNGVTINATGADTYEWNPGNLTGASVTVDPTSTSTYTVIGTITSTGCTASDNMVVTVSDVVAPPGVTNCEGISSTFTASGAVDYTWQPGSLTGATITVTPTDTTTYVVSGTDPSGCITIDSVLVTVNPRPIVTASNDTLVIRGEAATLSASGADTYSWSPGSLSGQTVNAVTHNNTTYTVTGTFSSTGCNNTDQVQVDVIDIPTVSGVLSIKAQDSTSLVASGPSGSSFNWYDAETGGNLLMTGATFNTGPLSQSTAFYIALDDGVNESPRIPIHVDAADSTIVSIGAAEPTICPGATTDLGASLNGPGVINWYDAASGGTLLGTTESGLGFPVSPSATQTFYAQGETRETNAVFNYTGGVQTFTVPAGVTSIEIDAYGARGGNSYGSGNTPGYGGRVQATMNVTPGQLLHIYVGGQGESYANYSNQLKGGWNGGGHGTNTGQGGGGGGATDIRINGTSTSDRVLVAGGAGGKSPITCTQGSTAKPHGGGLTGARGAYCTGGSGEAKRGRGGSQTAGGAPGCWYSGSSCGGRGGFGYGGTGGSVSGNGRAGGGGGGWYGGGGGTYNSDGGGGSSYTKERIFQNVVHTPGVRNGHGQLIITYSKNSVSNTMLPVTVNVEDAIAPVPDVSSLADEIGDPPLTVPAPTATDECAGGITATTMDPTTYNSDGTFVIQWDYDDGNGNISSQNQTVIVGSGLPVELSEFSARCERDQVILKWVTDSEINSSHFEIQRSRDGLAWENVGHKKSVGDYNTTMTYFHKDLSQRGHNLYRLKQVDLDGTTSYSNIIQADCSDNEVKVKLFPNPTSDQLTISIEGQERESFTLQLINELGQVLQQEHVELQNGWSEIDLSLDDYPVGLYELRVLGDQDFQSLRVMKVDNK